MRIASEYDQAIRPSLFMPESLRFLVVVLLPILGIMLVLAWWVRRMNTPSDMRWPRRRRRGRRRSERDLPTPTN
jgi:flagellar biogenesis protein FliO